MKRNILHRGCFVTYYPKGEYHPFFYTMKLPFQVAFDFIVIIKQILR